MLTRLRQRLADDRGFTLTELLLASTIGVVVCGATLSLVEISLKTQNDAAARVTSVQDGRGVMNDVARIIRSQAPCVGNPASVALVVAKDDTMTINTAIGGDTSTATETSSGGVRYQPLQQRVLTFNASAMTLTEQVYNGVGSSPNATTFPTLTRTRIMGNRLRLIGSTAFFTYYAYTASAPYTPTVQLTPGAGGLSAADRARVARIDVNFAVRSRDSDSTKDTRYSERLSTRIADPDDPTNWSSCT